MGDDCGSKKNSILVADYTEINVTLMETLLRDNNYR